MDKLTGLEHSFPLDEQGKRRTALAERAAEICAITERLLFALGHEWHAYNFEQVETGGVIFNVQYPGGNGTTWVTSGVLTLDAQDDEIIAEHVAAWWDREFRGVNPPLQKDE